MQKNHSPGFGTANNEEHKATILTFQTRQQQYTQACSDEFTPHPNKPTNTDYKRNTIGFLHKDK